MSARKPGLLGLRAVDLLAAAQGPEQAQVITEFAETENTAERAQGHGHPEDSATDDAEALYDI